MRPRPRLSARHAQAIVCCVDGEEFRIQIGVIRREGLIDRAIAPGIVIKGLHERGIARFRDLLDSIQVVVGVIVVIRIGARNPMLGAQYVAVIVRSACAPRRRISAAHQRVGVAT